MENVLKGTKEEKRRKRILEGPIWKAILMVAVPLVLYNLCNYLYGVYDLLVVQRSGIGSAGSISFFDQVKNMIATVGSAIASAGGILIARHYGAGDILKAKKTVNTTFTICLIVALITIFVFIPFAQPFLTLLHTSQSMMDESIGYFCMQMLVLGLTTMNNIFIAEEKAKGNTKMILFLNLGVVVIKIGLTTFIASGIIPNVNTTWIAGATAVAQGFMFVFGMSILFSRKNPLGVRIKELNLNKEYLKPLLLLALPVFAGRFLFHYGKVAVQSTLLEAYDTPDNEAYTKMIVGALGISNTITGLASNILNSFEDATATVISQNYGNKNGKRTIDAFKTNILFCLGVALISTTLLIAFQNPIAEFFAPGDLMQQEMIQNIVKYERLDIFFMGLHSVACAFLYGFGKTRITMSISIAQIFVFRLPSLLFMIHVLHMDYECAGVAMLFSNTMTGIIAFTLVLILISRMKKSNKYKEIFQSSI